MNQSSDTILKIEDLTVSYGTFDAIKNIDFTLAKNETLVLVGPSGSGKSTVLYAITGLLNQTAKIKGKIFYKGNIMNMILPEERNIPLLLQDLALFPHLTVKENIIFPLKIKKCNKDDIKNKTDKIIDLFQIDKTLLDRSINELSGGEQQRVALGRALISFIDSKEHNLLLLDEPLSSLDSHLKNDIIEEIKKLRKEFEISIIYVTHNKEEAFKLADRIGIMDNGRLLQLNNAEEIYNNPASKFIANFLDIKNFFRAKIIKTYKDNYILKTNGLIGEIKAHISNKENYQVGEMVFVNINTNDLFLVENNDDLQFNNYSGQLKDIYYFGEYWELKVDSFLIRESNLTNLPKIGDSIKISWRIKNTKLHKILNHDEN